jgi:hypothetical protein
MDPVALWLLCGLASSTAFTISQRGNGNGGPLTPKPDITPAGQQPTRRVYHFNPATIAECGSPCEEGGPAACDCGAVTWTNQPVKPEFPLPRKIKEDWQ